MDTSQAKTSTAQLRVSASGPLADWHFELFKLHLQDTRFPVCWWTMTYRHDVSLLLEEIARLKAELDRKSGGAEDEK